MRSPALSALLLLAATPLLMAERCGPATALQPAYMPGAVATDDALVGAYLAVSADAPKGPLPQARIVREETRDGPSYVLTVRGEKDFDLVAMRMFLFEIEGVADVRFADLVAEDLSKGGALAKGLSLPQHLLLKISRPAGGGVTLEYLDAEWVDQEVAKDPSALPTAVVPRQYRPNASGALTSENDPILIGNATVLRGLLARAAPIPAAWNLGLELVKKGAPALSFKLTVEDREVSRDASGHTSTFTVVGSRLSYTSTVSGRDQGMPGMKDSAASGVLTNPAAIDALLRAFAKTKPAVPKVKVPKTDTHIVRLCLERDHKPRCVERVKGDDSGADLQALRNLEAALRQHIVLPAP